MSTESRTRLSRRTLLRQTGCGFGALALAAMLGEESASAASIAANPLAPKVPHFAPRAKRIIFLYMHGGPSHMDTFDPKPKLDQDSGKPIPFQRGLTFDAKNVGALMKSPFQFKQYGQSGIPVSNLFPNVATCVDDLCIIRSMVGDGVDHGAALLQLSTGSFSFDRPSMGSWMLYGLGTENQNLPGFVVVKPLMLHGGARNWGSSFLPGAYQGTPIGNDKMETSELREEPIEHLIPKGVSAGQQRYELELLEKMNRGYAQARRYDGRLEARIQTFELAARMQGEAHEAFDVSKESPETRKLYGLDDKMTEDYGWKCLLARRLVERGVRFVQCYHTPNGPGITWDQHAELARLHAKNARQVDQPIAALLKDLKARGLLKDTLVLWGGEFGRTPWAQGDGRDHNPYGFTMWMAGGGVKPGTICGATDEYGYHAIEDRMHIHDLHATILHLFGLDHEKLTYVYDGRPFRLTDVAGVVAKKILA